MQNARAFELMTTVRSDASNHAFVACRPRFGERRT
jgi:hypothetical protein